MTRLVMPVYVHDPSSDMGVLSEPMVYLNTEVKGYFVQQPDIRLDHNGDLIIREGYKWDYGSGPALNTVEMVYASLGHDAFYDLIVRGELPKSARLAADVEFRKRLRKAGASWLRAWIAFIGVRVGYVPWKILT